jgi:transposase
MQALNLTRLPRASKISYFSDRLLGDGMSIREAAAALGIHKSKVERLKKRAVEKEMLDA